MARPSFIVLPAADLGAAKTFYERAFGWSLTSFGPTYACTMTGDVDIGLQADMAEAPTAPLVVLQVDDLEASLSAVTEAGGTIVRPIFAFPGGRRFHFRNPNGLELGVFVAEVES